MTHPLLKLEVQAQFFQSLWQEASPRPEREILRLAILRELHHWLHAQVSQALATGQRDYAKSLQKHQEQILALSHCSLADSSSTYSDLFELLKTTSSLPKKERPLPPSLLEIFEQKDFSRQDRYWENALAYEAASHHWQFWKTTTTLPLKDVETWNNDFSKKLWPNGVILWIESEKPWKKMENSTWTGHWIIILSPSIQPEEWGLLYSHEMG